MSDRNLDDLDPRLKALCQTWMSVCGQKGIKVGISQTYRSEEEQNADYAQGRTTPGKVITNARYGQSPHNCVDANGRPAARAFDFFIYNDDGKTLDWNPADAKWQAAIAAGEGLGMVSGSVFHLRDNDHFEMAGWKS